LTLFAIGIFAAILLVGSNFIGLRTLLYPVRLVAVALHEFGHAAVAVLSGARLESVVIGAQIYVPASITA
jgi:hypothetical protein